MNQKVALNIGIIIVIVIGLYFVFASRATAPTSNDVTQSTSTAATTSVPVADSKKPVTKPVSNTPQAPDISVAPHFAASVDSATRDAINTRLAAARDSIQEFPNSVDAWFNISAMYKAAGDYAMTAKILDYTAKQWPNNTVSFNNLGDLYANYLKDYPKAEAAYLSQIKIIATDLNAYRALFTLYTTTSYKPSNTAAEDILKKGIAANPEAYDLEVLLARYYVSTGRTADAKIEFDAAIAAARKAGKTDIATQIQQEEAALK